MSELRIRIKFGEHEFEAEGEREAVERQLDAFTRLIAPLTDGRSINEMQRAIPSETSLPLEKIMRVEGRVVSLTVAAKAEEAVLAVLLGQRQFRQNEVVSGGEIMKGLRESQLHIQRADSILSKHARTGNIIAIGKRRTLRYRLSAKGVDRAQQIARQLIAQAPG